MLKVENLFPCALSSLQSTMSIFVHRQPNRWQSILFVAIQCNSVYFSATRQCTASQSGYIAHTTYTRKHTNNTLYLSYLMRIRCRSLSCNIRTLTQVRLMIVCHSGHCHVWIDNCAKSDVEQDVLCAITVRRSYYVARVIVVMYFVAKRKIFLP